MKLYRKRGILMKCTNCGNDDQSTSRMKVIRSTVQNVFSGF